MKYHLTTLYFASFVLLLTPSCSEGNDSNNSETDSNNETTANETVQENKTKADGPFEIESGVIHYEKRNLAGEVKGVYSLYFDNYGSRVKLEETIQGETSIYVYDDATKKGATLWAGKDKPIKSYSKQGELLMFTAVRSASGFTQINDAVLLGKGCIVYANNAKSEDGTSKLTYWQHKGITLKEINKLGMGYIFEATKFEVKSIEADTFSLLDKV